MEIAGVARVFFLRLQGSEKPAPFTKNVKSAALANSKAKAAPPAMWFILMVDPCSTYMRAVTERMSYGYCGSDPITKNDLPSRMDATGQPVAVVSNIATPGE
jgi:hypothetical protein